MRGMRTLHVRQERQSASAMTLAHRLSGHPLVTRVLYLGLARHPGHAVAARQTENGFGALHRHTAPIKSCDVYAVR